MMKCFLTPKTDSSRSQH